MPASRPEPNSPDPESNPAPAPDAAPRAGLQAWLPLLVTILVMPLAAYAMTRFVLVPRLKSELGAAPALEVRAKAPGDKTPAANRESVPMTKLLVNVAGTMGGRYLLVSLSVVGSSPDFKAKMQAHEPQLRDMACGTLAAKTLADLEKPGARNLIRSELISGFNNILGGAAVQEIYLTEFAIQ